MDQPLWVRSYRMFFALLTLAAIAYQYSVVNDREDFSPVNFFSFFTIQCNIFATAVLSIGASGAAIAGYPSLRWDLIRGAATIYMATTGVVYGLLLSGYQEALQTTEPWVNTVLHKVMPLVMVMDFLIQPLAHRVTFRQALVWIVYPVVYLVYSLIRGPIVDWYPYPFLNPDEAGGYFGVAAYCLGITVGLLAFVKLVTATGQRLRLRLASDQAEDIAPASVAP